MMGNLRYVARFLATCIPLREIFSLAAMLEAKSIRLRQQLHRQEAALSSNAPRTLAAMVWRAETQSLVSFHRARRRLSKFQANWTSRRNLPSSSSRPSEPSSVG